VGEILAEMIVGNVLSSRLCEPWALWELIAQLLEPFHPARAAMGPEAGVSITRKRNLDDGKSQEAKAAAKSNFTSGTNRLEPFGLLRSKVQASGPADDTAGLMTGEPATVQGFRHRYSFANTFWQLMNYGILAITAVRAVVLILLSARNLPLRTTNTTSATASPLTTSMPIDHKAWTRDSKGSPMPAARQDQLGYKPRPIFLMAAWNMASDLIELPARMPWLYGILCLAQKSMVAGPGRVGDTDGILDR
jgi:hypothetical protein